MDNNKTDKDQVIKTVANALLSQCKKKKTAEKELLKTPVFTVVEKTFHYIAGEIVQGPELDFKPVGLNCPDWCTIIAKDSYGQTIIVKQTRWGVEEETTEFPCGMVEVGEAPIDAAVREFKEETGISLGTHQLTEIATFNPNPAYFNNKMHVFYVNLLGSLKELLESADAQSLDEHEDCKVFLSRLDEDLIAKMSNSSISLAAICSLYKIGEIS